MWPKLRGELAVGKVAEAPGFRAVNLAAKLKRQISHAKFTAHQIPPGLWMVAVISWWGLDGYCWCYQWPPVFN